METWHADQLHRAKNVAAPGTFFRRQAQELACRRTFKIHSNRVGVQLVSNVSLAPLHAIVASEVRRTDAIRGQAATVTLLLVLARSG